MSALRLSFDLKNKTTTKTLLLAHSMQIVSFLAPEKNRAVFAPDAAVIVGSKSVNVMGRLKGDVIRTSTSVLLSDLSIMPKCWLCPVAPFCVLTLHVYSRALHGSGC